MQFKRFRAPRFGLKTLLVLILGIAIGFSLNLETYKLLTGRSPYATTLGPYVVGPPDILTVNVSYTENGASKSISGQYLVGPDGRINLNAWGTVYVSGLTIEETANAIEKLAATTVTTPHAVVDVFAYNSQCFYVITPSPTGGDNVIKIIFSGNETVLDAIAQVGGIQSTSTTQISVARQNRMFNVDWAGITRSGSDATNYLLLPGDRVVVKNAVVPPANN